MARTYDWRLRDKERYNAYQRSYRKRPHVAAYFRELNRNHNRRRSPNYCNYRLAKNLRSRLYMAIWKTEKSQSARSLLGCSIEDLWIYLESKFEDGMTRENYGAFWEIDHIIPCALFDLSKPDHQKRCFHFSNLQPLKVLVNRQKGVALQYG